MLCGRYRRSTGCSVSRARRSPTSAGAGDGRRSRSRALSGCEGSRFDIDAPSVEMARSNLAENADVAQRVTFTQCDASELPDENFQAAFAFECVHDMPRPVEVLAAVRRSLAPGGS